MLDNILRLQPLGINFDQPAHVLGPEVWTSGYNVIFEDGRTRKSKGYANVVNAPLHIPEVLAYTPAGGDYWVYAGATGVGVWDGASHTDLTPVGWVAPPAGGLTICLINNLVVVNNQSMAPMYWTGLLGDKMQTLPGWADLPANTYAKGVAANLYHLFAFDVVEGANDYAHNRVRWSDAAQPGTVPGQWKVLATNQANFVDLATPSGRIVGGKTLRENMVLYKERSCHLFQYVGGSYVYDVSTLFETVGMMAPGCVVELDGSHVVLTQDDIIMHDGNTIVSIADKVAKHELFDNMQRNLSHRAFLHLDRNNEQIYVGWPDFDAVDGCNRMLIYCYTDKTWTERTFKGVISTNSTLREFYSAAVGKYAQPGEAGTEWDAIPIPSWQAWGDSWDYQASTAASNMHVMGGQSNLWKLTNTPFDAGQPILAEVMKTGIDLGEIDANKRVVRLWPRFEEGEGNTVYIQVGVSEFANREPVWMPPAPFTIGQDRSIPVNQRGRALAIRISDDGGAETWALTGIDVEFRKAGRY